MHTISQLLNVAVETGASGSQVGYTKLWIKLVMKTENLRMLIRAPFISVDSKSLIHLWKQKVSSFWNYQLQNTDNHRWSIYYGYY